MAYAPICLGQFFGEHRIRKEYLIVLVRIHEQKVCIMPFANDLAQRCGMFGIPVISLTMLVEDVNGIPLRLRDDLTGNVGDLDGKIVIQCGSPF